jgi:hypothetical protein
VSCYVCHHCRVAREAQTKLQAHNTPLRDDALLAQAYLLCVSVPHSSGRDQCSSTTHNVAPTLPGGLLQE